MSGGTGRRSAGVHILPVRPSVAPTATGRTKLTDKLEIRTGAAPAPGPVFSQAVRKGSLLQVSGQVAQRPGSADYLHPGDVKGQTRQALENVRAVLEAGGADIEDVLMFRVYLRQRSDFAAMNEAYGEFVDEHVPSGVLPCRTTVFVDLADDALLVEIDALAVVD